MRPVQVMEVPALLPGRCFKCGSSSNELRDYYVDTGCDIDYLGVLYFCNSCLRDIVSNTPDLVHKDILDEHTATYQDIVANAEEAIAKYDALSVAMKDVGFDPEAFMSSALSLSTSLKEVPKLTTSLNKEVAKVTALENRVKELEAEKDRLKEMEAQQQSYDELLDKYSSVIRTLDEVSADKDRMMVRMQEMIEGALQEAEAELEPVNENQLVLGVEATTSSNEESPAPLLGLTLGK